MRTEKEKTWVRMINENGEEYKIVTKSEIDRSIYYLYKKVGNDWKHINKNEDPSVFDEVVF